MLLPDARDPNTPHDPGGPKCRYECGSPVTHFCEECAGGASGLSGYFCEFHARRHDLKDNGGTILAAPIRP
jgi:hypothetical protein